MTTQTTQVTIVTGAELVTTTTTTTHIPKTTGLITVTQTQHPPNLTSMNMSATIAVLTQPNTEMMLTVKMTTTITWSTATAPIVKLKQDGNLREKDMRSKE